MIDEGIEQFDNIDEQLRELNHKDGILVFPWEFRTGYVNNTENGYVEEDDPSNTNYLEKVFTGKENICVVWEKSTINVKPKNHNVMETVYGRGRYYIGKLISGRTDLKTIIEPIEDNESFLSMKDDDTITIAFYFPASTMLENLAQAYNEAEDKHYFYPTNEDKKKLYTIPEVGGDKFYYISNINLLTKITSSKIIGCEIEFSCIKDLLRKSGQASEQFIQYSAPGEPYSKPNITINEKGEKEVSFIKINKPRVNYLQFEMLGPGNITGINVIGRRFTDKGNSIEFKEWKWLLPYKFYTTQNNQLTHSAAPSKCLFYFPNEQIDIKTTIDWAQNYKEQNNAIARNNVAGKLTCGKVADWYDNVKLGNHKSNPTNDSNIRYDFFDQNWKPLEYLTEFSTYQLLGNMYCDDEITFNKDMTAIQLLIANSFIFLSQPQLPLSFTSSKPYRWSNVPIIGSLIAGIFGDRTLVPNTTSRKTMNYGYFMDADLASYFSCMGVQPTKDETQHSFFLNSFACEEVNEWLGVLSQNLSMCFELTDKFSVIPKDLTETLTFDTKYFGQYRYEPTWDETTQSEILGDYILPTKKSVLYNPTLTPLAPDSSEGFIIDKIIIFSNFMGKIRISCYSENKIMDKPCFTTTILSQPEFTKDFRQWMTIISTGGWKDKYISAQDSFTYPGYPIKNGNNIKDIKYEDNLRFEHLTHIEENILQRSDYLPLCCKIDGNTIEYKYKYTEFLPEIVTKEQFLAKYRGIRFYANLFGAVYEHNGMFNKDCIAQKTTTIDVIFSEDGTTQQEIVGTTFCSFGENPETLGINNGQCDSDYLKVKLYHEYPSIKISWNANVQYNQRITINIDFDDSNNNFIFKFTTNHFVWAENYSLADWNNDCSKGRSNTIRFPSPVISTWLAFNPSAEFSSNFLVSKFELLEK